MILFNFSYYLLLILISLPLLCSIILFLIPKQNKLILKKISLIFSFIILFNSILVWINFNPILFKFQMYNSFIWSFNKTYYLNIGIDYISLFFIILTSFLIIICFIYNWNNILVYLKEYLIILFLLEFFLFLIFISLDLLLLYFLFESILIPMFLLIGIWGSKVKKIRAAYLFFFYTLFGSIGFLIAIIYIYKKYQITSYPLLFWIQFTKIEEICLWFAFFLSFAAKVPMIPFHIWLPEAHVEAPTSGSVLLAGILLKLGVYGFLRFLIPLFPYANNYFLPFIYSLSIISIVYAALVAIRQIDLKKIIAYSSISHMNLIILGLFSMNSIGLQGSILQSLSHGFIASGLFLLIGFLYDRYHTRILKYYSGLIQLMPIFSFFFIFFIFSNIAIPGTSSFTGEFLILIGSFLINKSVTFLGATGMIFGGMYSLWLLNKVIYGNFKNNSIILTYDLTYREFYILSLLMFFILYLGLSPNILLNILN